jgi:6-pyruvoyltetrahydropterin/6-carboxytetrahydropterin synthase
VYEVGLAKDFRAWHVMPGMEGPEGQLHSHEYRLDVVISSEELDERGMVCDLDVVDSAFDQVIAIVKDQDLEMIRPPEMEAVTVEVLARWAHGELAGRIPTREGMGLAVRVWESPVAFGGYASSQSSY